MTSQHSDDPSRPIDEEVAEVLAPPTDTKCPHCHSDRTACFKPCLWQCYNCDYQWSDVDTLRIKHARMAALIRRMAAEIHELNSTNKVLSERKATTFTCALDQGAASVLAGLIADVGDEECAEITLILGDGHSGYGLYLTYTEYPDEGAFFVTPCAGRAPELKQPQQQDKP